MTCSCYEVVLSRDGRAVVSPRSTSPEADAGGSVPICPMTLGTAVVSGPSFLSLKWCGPSFLSLKRGPGAEKFFPASVAVVVRIRWHNWPVKIRNSGIHMYVMS